MKIDHEAKEKAKREKMAHPDWHKYSGFPPADASAPQPPEEPKKRGKIKLPAEPVESQSEPEAPAEDVDGN